MTQPSPSYGPDWASRELTGDTTLSSSMDRVNRACCSSDNIPFRPDWEKVITPIVDLLSERSDVDAEKIVLYGTSQGGYWVPGPRRSSIASRLSWLTPV